jgi:hypothetical protein
MLSFVLKICTCISFHTVRHQGPAVWQKCSIVAFILWWSCLQWWHWIVIQAFSGFYVGRLMRDPPPPWKKGFRCFQTTLIAPSGPALSLVPRHHLIMSVLQIMRLFGLVHSSLHGLKHASNHAIVFQTMQWTVQYMKLAKLKSSSSS